MSHLQNVNKGLPLCMSVKAQTRAASLLIDPPMPGLVLPKSQGLV